MGAPVTRPDVPCRLAALWEAGTQRTGGSWLGLTCAIDRVVDRKLPEQAQQVPQPLVAACNHAHLLLRGRGLVAHHDEFGEAVRVDEPEGQKGRARPGARFAPAGPCTRRRAAAPRSAGPAPPRTASTTQSSRSVRSTDNESSPVWPSSTVTIIESMRAQ